MNLAHLLDGHDPDSVAIISRNRSVTYGELTDYVARARGGLLAAGVRPGERVAILCGNNGYFVVAYLATLGIGAVAVPLNPTSPGPELARELIVVEPAAAVLDPAALATWQQLPPNAVGSVRLTVIADGAAPDGTVSLASLLTAEPAPIAAVAPDAVAAMMFTSGTAGPPRAAMLTHGNLRANLEQMDSADDRLLPSDVVYGVLPLFHIFGLNVVLAGALRAGSTLLLVQRFDPATAVDSFIQRGVTVVLGAPPIWVAFSTFDDLPSDAFSTVRLALSGASRLPPSAAERMKSRFGIDVYEGYGLTEAGPVVTSSAGAARPGSVGRVLDGQEVRLVDPDGDTVMVGDPGEVWVRGPNVFIGYYGEPEATARVLTSDGWLRTGDIATVDDAGYLYLVDRAKDMIIVSGFNVFPAEVEEVLSTHPAVAEVGVVGVAHPHHGEAVKAFVVLADGANTDEESLIDYAHDYLARYKCPSKIVFVDELPRNAAGKLVRRRLPGTARG